MIKDKILKKRIDTIVKIVLLIIIVLLLIHNYLLQKDKYQNNVPSPNGNVDIIDIKCDDRKCTVVPNNDDNNKSMNIEKLSFAQNKISIKEDGTLVLVPIIKPNSSIGAKLIWSSSDPSVVSVDANGKITALKEGTAVITVKSADGKSSTCVVNVVLNEKKIKEVELNPKKMSLKAGETEIIAAKVGPETATERDLVWTSSDSSIARVDSNGYVTGLKSGTVTITAKSKDGKVYATCTVTIVGSDETIDVYDNDKDPITWNGSTNLNIFTRSIYDIEGIIAPEDENTYQFVVRNSTKQVIKYSINFIETNPFKINMNYKLKKNDTYLFDKYTKPSNLKVIDVVLNPNENDTYYLDWKWISSSNDTQIGSNPEAKYGFKIEVKAESIDE